MENRNLFISDIRKRKSFFAGVFGLFLFLLPYYSVLILPFILIYDINSKESKKKYLSLLAFVSYILLFIPYLSIIYLDSSDI